MFHNCACTLVDIELGHLIGFDTERERESIRNFWILLHGECCFIFLMSGDVVRVAVVVEVPVADMVMINL